MKLFFLLGVILLSGLFVPAQTADSPINNYQLNHDSISALVEKTMDSFSKTLPDNDAVLQQEQSSRNINNILELQQENRTKQKKAAMIRIAIGVGFLILLIVGLLRKRKK